MTRYSVYGQYLAFSLFVCSFIVGGFHQNVAAASVPSTLSPEKPPEKLPPAPIKFITLNTTGQPPLNTPQQKGFMDLVSKEAFKRIGIELDTIQLPAERGLKNVDTGIDDGEMSRVAGLEKKYKNLIRVPEKIMDWEFVAFSPLDITLNNGWKDLEPYSIAYINGWKILENNVNFSGVIKVRSPDQLFKLLEKKRVDIILYERWAGLLANSKFKIANTKIIKPSLAKKTMYIYLHKKHKALVKPLSQSLLAMKNDGSYQKLFNEILGDLDQ